MLSGYLMFLLMLVMKAAEEWSLVSIELDMNRPCSEMMNDSDFSLAVDFSCAVKWSKLLLLIFLPLFIAVDLEIHRAYWQVLLPRTWLAQRLIVSIQESSQLQMLDILGDLPYGKFKLRSSAWEEIE